MRTKYRWYLTSPKVLAIVSRRVAQVAIVQTCEAESQIKVHDLLMRLRMGSLLAKSCSLVMGKVKVREPVR